ncbi:MAG: hypothetical protein MUC94_10870 [bacterium]|nr:hypothetical protein [bacterium]
MVAMLTALFTICIVALLVVFFQPIISFIIGIIVMPVGFIIGIFKKETYANKWLTWVTIICLTIALIVIICARLIYPL